MEIFYFYRMKMYIFRAIKFTHYYHIFFMVTFRLRSLLIRVRMLDNLLYYYSLSFIVLLFIHSLYYCTINVEYNCTFVSIILYYSTNIQFLIIIVTDFCHLPSIKY